MPQGFGFESRKGDRRQVEDRRANDRRGGTDRRSGDRRGGVAGAMVERRLSGDRRARVRRALARRNSLRRLRADRRAPESRESDGLRITQHGFRFRPSTYDVRAQAPPSAN